MPLLFLVKAATLLASVVIGQRSLLISLLTSLLITDASLVLTVGSLSIVVASSPAMGTFITFFYYVFNIFFGLYKFNIVVNAVFACAIVHLAIEFVPKSRLVVLPALLGCSNSRRQDTRITHLLTDDSTDPVTSIHSFAG